MKFWSILFQISVTNFVLPTSSEVTPSNSPQFDRLENLLEAVDSKVERDDYYEDEYGNYETGVPETIPDEAYPEPVLTERVQDEVQSRSHQPFAQGYRQTRQQRRITYQQVIQLLESHKRNQRKEYDQLLDAKESEIDKLRHRVSQLEDNFDIALSELESKLTRSFRAEIDSKFGSIRNVGIDLDKERLEGLEEKVNELDEKISSVTTNDLTDSNSEKQNDYGDVLSRIVKCETDISQNEVEINRISSDALTLKKELISEMEYRQSISNDRFAALENTQSSAKSIDQVEMDNIWDQLEIVSKKVDNFTMLHDTEDTHSFILSRVGNILNESSRNNLADVGREFEKKLLALESRLNNRIKEATQSQDTQDLTIYIDDKIQAVKDFIRKMITDADIDSYSNLATDLQNKLGQLKTHLMDQDLRLTGEINDLRRNYEELTYQIADVTSPSRFGGLSSDEMDRINSQLARYRKSLLAAITDIDKIQGNIEGVHQEINDLKSDNIVFNQKISDQHSKVTNQNILFDEIDGKINILNSTLSKKITKEHFESSQRDQTIDIRLENFESSIGRLDDSVTETRTLIFDRTSMLEQSVKLVKDHVDRKEAQETFDLQKIENRVTVLDGIKESLENKIKDIEDIINLLESSAYELGESDNAIKQQLEELEQSADQLESNQIKIRQEITTDFENFKSQTILQQNDIYDFIETKIDSIPKQNSNTLIPAPVFDPSSLKRRIQKLESSLENLSSDLKKINLDIFTDKDQTHEKLLQILQQKLDDIPDNISDELKDIQKSFSRIVEQSQDLRAKFAELESKSSDDSFFEQPEMPTTTKIVLTESPVITSSPWSEWSKCSSECSRSGYRTRSNSAQTEREICYYCPEWSSWSDCTVTCGIGQKMRSRVVNGRRATDSATCMQPRCPKTTTIPITNSETDLFLGSQNFKRGDLLLIGGKSKSGVSRQLSIYNLESGATRQLIRPSDWSAGGGPSRGFYRHCTVKVENEIYVLGGQYSKRDIYQIGISKIEKMKQRLSLDMYLHQCATFNQRLWICAPSRSRGDTCISMDNDFGDTKTEARLKQNHYNGGLVSLGSHLLMTAGGNPKTGKTEILYRSSTEWMNFSPLNEAISGHQAVFTNDAIFVTGGYNGKISSNIIQRLDFSCRTNRSCLSKPPSWEIKGHLLRGRDGHLSVLFNQNIYSLGGYTNNPIGDEKLEENGQSTALSERRQIWCMTGILLVDA